MQKIIIRRESKQMKTWKIMLMAVVLALVAAGWAQADTATSTLTINAKINAKAKLSLNTPTITFDDSGIDPDTTTTMPSSPATVGITAKVKTGSSTVATLTCLASGDFDPAIPVSAVTWTSGSTNYAPTGTMDKTTAQNVASRTGSGDLSGTITPLMATSWNYPTGNYSVTVTYTLTAP